MKISVTEIMKKDKNGKVLKKINSNVCYKAIYDSMVKLEKMGIYLSDYECFRHCSFYTGEKPVKLMAS